MSAMKTIAFGAAARLRPATDEPKPDQTLDAAWIVLEAANDLADHSTVAICQRVIDANLNGTPPSPSDLHVVIDYFR
jgi:hypothetical protein